MYFWLFFAKIGPHEPLPRFTKEVVSFDLWIIYHCRRNATEQLDVFVLWRVVRNRNQRNKSDQNREKLHTERPPRARTVVGNPLAGNTIEGPFAGCLCDCGLPLLSKT